MEIIELMKKKKIGVVILNYLAYEESIELTNQFLELESPGNCTDMHIVIVDNSSANESYDILSKKFVGNPKVTVAQTNKNLGFANGNNYGYKVLLKVFIPDYVIFSNSDIVLKDKNLFKWIIDNDKQHQFGILGPSVWSLRGNFHQNPLDNRKTNLVWNELQLKKQYLRKIKLHIVNTFPFLHDLKHMIHKSAEQTANADWGDYTKYTEEKTLHGSFLVMSQRYLSQYETPFDPGTFLYMEEDLLKLRCMKKHIKMVFSPDYEVNHKQAVSTKKVDRSKTKRKIIRINNEINSLKRYIEVIKKK